MLSYLDLFLKNEELLIVCFKLVVIGAKKLEFKELLTCNTSFPTVFILP